MGKCSKSKKAKVPKMSEEEYAQYIMSLKDEKPTAGFRESISGHSVPHEGKDSPDP